MDWGDAPAWAALAVSVVAVVAAILARNDSKRSADAAVGSLTLQREEAEERRKAAEPKPQLAIEHVREVRYLLRNIGDAAAVRIVFEEGLPRTVLDLPGEPFTLQPGEAHSFKIDDLLHVPAPAQLYVKWEGQETCVALPVPTPRKAR